MQYERNSLPWRLDLSVFRTEDLCHDVLADLRGLLPETRIYFQPHAENQIPILVDQLVPAMWYERDVWLGRLEKFRQLALLSDHRVVTLLNHSRPHGWILYENGVGGLDFQNHDSANYGCVPCTSMVNHGVAWSGSDVWLATSRKPNLEWDVDSDFGHEATHAVFAFVPLFVQGQLTSLASLKSIVRLTQVLPAHLIAIMYWATELTVVGLRGESRDTQSGLPLNDPSDVSCLLRLWDLIAPSYGFDGALMAWSKSNSQLDMQSDLAYQITAPFLSIAPAMWQFAGIKKSPMVAEVVQALK
jgi:hypothetical protein